MKIIRSHKKRCNLAPILANRPPSLLQLKAEAEKYILKKSYKINQRLAVLALLFLLNLKRKYS